VSSSGILSQTKHQVSHLEASGPNASGVVASQRLLIPRRVKQGNVPSLFELVQRVLSASLVASVVVLLCPWGTVF
jgi:hypothetical protein